MIVCDVMWLQCMWLYVWLMYVMWCSIGSDKLPKVLARTGSGNGTMVDLSGKECCHHLPPITTSTSTIMQHRHSSGSFINNCFVLVMRKREWFIFTLMFRQLGSLYLHCKWLQHRALIACLTRSSILVASRYPTQFLSFRCCSFTQRLLPQILVVLLG